MSVSYNGETFDLGTVVVPLVFPADLLANNTGTFNLTDARLDDVALLDAGTGAFFPCFNEGTGDTVGGWRYTGGPGSLEVALFFTSDGADVTDLGFRATFEGPASVEFDDELVEEGGPADINDRCTPQDSAESFWDYRTDG